MTLTRRAVLAAGATAIAASVPASARESEQWSLARGDGRNTGHVSLGAPEGGLDEAWERTFDADVRAAPTIATGVAYLGLADGRVLGVNVADGDVVERGAIDGTPTAVVSAAAERLLVPASDGAVHSLSRSDGEHEWTARVGGGVSSPVTVLGNDVVLGTEDGVTALDAASGETRWTRSLPTAVQYPPAIVGDAVVVRDRRGLVVAFDRASGAERWRRSYHTGWLAGFKGPAVRDGTVYVEGHAPTAGEDGAVPAEERELVALDLASGEPVFRHSLDGDVLSLTTSPDRVFVSLGGVVEAYDPTDGTIVWRDERSDTRVHLASVTDAVYAATRDGVTVYDAANGDVRSRFSPEDASFGGFIPVDGGVLAVEDRRRIVAIRRSSGLDALAIGGGAGLLGVAGYAAYRWRRAAARGSATGEADGTGDR